MISPTPIPAPAGATRRPPLPLPGDRHEQRLPVLLHAERPMTAWTAGDSMKSAKAFPAAAFTRGPLAGLTSMTE